MQGDNFLSVYTCPPHNFTGSICYHSFLPSAFQHIAVAKWQFHWQPDQKDEIPKLPTGVTGAGVGIGVGAGVGMTPTRVERMAL